MYQKGFRSSLVALIILTVFAVILWMCPNAAAGAEIPHKTGKMVYDFAGVLDASQVNTLETQVRAYEQQTGVEIALMTVQNIDGYSSIEEFSATVFKAWGIGKAGANNGLLIVNTIKERKFRLEVGYGLEDVITDYEAGKIIQTDAIPYLKRGDYFNAYFTTITSLKHKIGTMTIAQREAWKAQQKQEADRQRAESWATFLNWTPIIGIFLFSIALAGFAYYWYKVRPKRELQRKKEEERLRQENEWIAKMQERRKQREEQSYMGSPATSGAVFGTIAVVSEHIKKVAKEAPKKRETSDNDDSFKHHRSSDDDNNSSSGSSFGGGGGFDFGGGSSGGGGATGSY